MANSLLYNYFLMVYTLWQNPGNNLDHSTFYEKYETNIIYAPFFHAVLKHIQ